MTFDELMARDELGGFTREDMRAESFGLDGMFRVAQAEGITVSELLAWIEAGLPHKITRRRWSAARPHRR